MFSLDSSIIQDLRLLNLIKPETASIETLNTIIGIHKDILNSIGTILDSFGMLPRISSDKSSGKKKAIIKHIYEFKQTICRNNYFNNFKLNKFVAIKTNNNPFPTISTINNGITQIFTPESATLFGNQYDLRKEKNTTVNSDLARVIQYFYQLVEKNTEITQDIYTMVSKEQKETESYSSFASLPFNDAGSDIVYTISFTEAGFNQREVKQKIDSFSYDFIYASKTKEKIETNNVNLLDKSDAIISSLEKKIQSGDTSELQKQKLKNKIAQKKKMFNVKASDISDGIDQLLTQFVIAPELNLQNINISDILPQFKIEILTGFEDGNLSLPIWQTLDKIVPTDSSIFCRLTIDTSQVQNKQLINKVLQTLEYPNKYFIVGTQNV